ncbi:uncharacterized conserved protein [Microbacterium testaceum StLB037]|uniref:Uncharacterized conserved protein n=2 Tax=Microbacterium testaceum TaxID=2033 RepID=E8NFA9_MICTS|nr:uncharacterized conserved protein [Microbacterium testaceum StLB037]
MDMPNGRGPVSIVRDPLRDVWTTARASTHRRTMTHHDGAADAGSAEPLFVVQRYPSQHLVARGIGILFMGGAVVLAASEIIERDPLAYIGITVWLTTLGGLGAIIFFYALSLGRARILVFDDHLVVRSGRRRARTVPASDIVELAALMSGRIRGRDARGRTLFETMSVYQGFPEFTSWLQEKAPRAWAEMTG